MRGEQALFEVYSQAHNDELQMALGFSPDDLAVNREGVLSSAQKRPMRPKLYLGSVFLMMMGLFFLGAPTLPPDRLPPQYRDRPVGQIAAIGISLGLIAMGAYGLITAEKRLAAHSVLSVDGPVSCSKFSGFNSATLIVSDHKFRLNWPTYKIFHTGEHYRIYYISADNQILSAEHHITSDDHEQEA